ncbi:LemA family protein [Dokdonella sp.]|uniref:LemA family protein n=1 Tax=Dokdonella sp. TaxID=2291710 RepID=UPI0031BF0C9D|nr:LemA family protein [Dokdonella sp.]
MGPWWLAAFGLVILAGIIILFNALVAARNQVRAAWSDIDVQLTRRHDLVPQLVSTVKAYARHEQATLEAVASLRARALAAASPAHKAGAEDALARGVTQLLALEERYPDLKANANFLQLQRDLVAIEDHLQYARRFYNGAVRDLNNHIERFPSLLVARLARFRPAEFYRADGAVEAPV